MPLPANLSGIADLIETLGQAGVAAAHRAARSTFRAIDRCRKGKRLPDATALAAVADAEAATATPMWDVLAAKLDLALKIHGSRARLARHLGVPRQRITEFIKGRRSPDAEMTLRLLHWLALAQSGRDISGIVPPDPDQFPPAA